jgi:predicted DNA-binding transcriptional regulator AlpA
MYPQPLLTKRAVAELLGYHPQTVMCLVREDRFPKPLKVNGVKSAVRFRASDIAAWIERNIGSARKNRRVSAIKFRMQEK